MVDNPRATDEEFAVADTTVAGDEPAAAETADAAAPSGSRTGEGRATSSGSNASADRSTTTGPDIAADPNGTAPNVTAESSESPESPDAADADVADVAPGEFVDLGSLALRLPAGARPRVTGTPGSASHALYLRVPEGHISVSVLAAPADRPLWPEFAEAISSAVQGGEGSVLTQEGEWGTEVQSGSGGELTWYIGRDGPLWLLYGTATGPAEHSARLASSVRALLREAQVRRGNESLPDKTTLALRLPPGYEADAASTGYRGRAERAGNRNARTAAEAGAIGAVAGAAAAAGPELKPLPGPPAASWHPAYHGTSSTGPKPPAPESRPTPERRPTPGRRPTPERRVPREDVREASPASVSPSSSQWPEWLDDPLAPAPGETAAEPLVTSGTRAPKTRTLLVVGALILLIGAAGIAAGLTGAVHVSPQPTASGTRPAAPGPQPDDGPPAIGLPADPAAPGTAPSPAAPLPGQLGPAIPQAAPGPATGPAPAPVPGSASGGPVPGVDRGGSAPDAAHQGRTGIPPSASAAPPGHRQTAASARGGSAQAGPVRGGSARAAHGPSRQRDSSPAVGTRATGRNEEVTDRHSSRRSGRDDDADRDNRDSRADDEDCGCDDDRSSHGSDGDGPLRHRTGVTTAGRGHGPLLGLLGSALGGL